MTEYSEKDLNYALDAIQDPEIRKSEEFKNWISKAENRNLFIELMAGREAVMREKYLRKYALRKRIKIISIVSAVAAASLLAIFLPDFFHSTPLPETNRDIRFFTANTNVNEVILEVENKTPEVIKDTFMVMDVSHEAVTKDEIPYQTIKTPRGKDFHLTLSDGTKVWINTESCLKFPSVFSGNERRVTLKGEAYFEVAHNKECPFIVSTEGIDTKVLGTKFNVCSYGKEQRHVTLVEGKVEVNNIVSEETTILNPGENITYDKDDKSRKSEVNTAVYTAWTEGMFYFEDKPLNEIMNTLGRWYNVNIYFENESLYNITFNFWASRNSSIEEAVNMLNSMGKVKIDFTDNKITVRNN